MPGTSAPIRLIATTLTLVMLAFPVAATYVAGTDCHAQAGATSCCQHEQTATDDSSSNRENDAEDCGVSCLSVCCRAIDVPRNDLRPVGGRALVLPLVLFAQSVHTPILCDAIFHPPRV